MDPRLHILNLLYQMNERYDADGSELKADSKYTMFVSTELQQVETKLYETKYPELKAKMLLPVDHSTHNGARTVAYDMYDQYGEAALISNYADDLPLVDVAKERFTGKIQSYGDAYQYSLEDIRAAQFAGQSLDSLRAITARRVMEFKFEEVAAVGNGPGGLKGVLNHPNIPLYTPLTGTWSSATADQMLADLHSFVDQIITANKETWYPDTLVLDGPSYRRIGRARLDNQAKETVLEAFIREQEKSGWIRQIDSWAKCVNADAAGTGPRFLCYKKDPTVVQLDIPQEFETFPPQAQNLAFVVPCHARIAGVKVRYPLAMGYMDGC